MRKMIFPTLVLTAIALGVATPLRVFSADEVRVVYPTQATDVSELDSSTVSKRAEPPVREESEFDPVTPIGQIKAVRDALTRLEEAVAALRSASRQDDDALVAKLGERLPTRQRVDEIFPLLIQSSADGAEAKSGVASLLKTTDGLGAKIDSLAKTTENLRATVESAQKTAASVEKIRTSRWTDVAVFAILALVAIQLVIKVGSVVAGAVKASKARLDERVLEMAEQLIAAKKSTTTTKKEASK